MKVQGKRKRGRPKKSCVDRVRDDIKENCRGTTCTTVLHGDVHIINHRAPHKSWT